jgi:hypothetical protein
MCSSAPKASLSFSLQQEISGEPPSWWAASVAFRLQNNRGFRPMEVCVYSERKQDGGIIPSSCSSAGHSDPCGMVRLFCLHHSVFFSGYPRAAFDKRNLSFGLPDVAPNFFQKIMIPHSIAA